MKLLDHGSWVIRMIDRELYRKDCLKAVSYVFAFLFPCQYCLHSADFVYVTPTHGAYSSYDDIQEPEAKRKTNETLLTDSNA